MTSHIQHSQSSEIIEVEIGKTLGVDMADEGGVQGTEVTMKNSHRDSGDKAVSILKATWNYICKKTHRHMHTHACTHTHNESMCACGFEDPLTFPHWPHYCISHF